jgi:two-component system chemotaxis sensor kinase CheA
MDQEALDPASALEIDRRALLPVFVAECEENLAALEETLLSLEESPEDEGILATIFRATHTLKGNAESIGFGAIAACAHAMESVLEALRSRSVAADGALVSVLLDGNDALRTMVSAVASGGEPALADHAEVMKRLGALVGATAATAEESATAPQAHGPATPTQGRTLRVDCATLDRIVTHLEELSIARARLRVALDHDAPRAELADVLAETERHFDDLREKVMRLRLVPVGPLFRAQARAIRDIAVTHGKSARLVVEGADVEADNTVLEALKGPITHMVRNALDHGLETPDARRARGKDPTGTITLQAGHESGRLVVRVSDDGQGFRRDRILARARALGLVAGDGAALEDREVFAFVFAPGFSTAEAVTDLSGRGVGMDVVGHSVSALKGQVEVESTEGLGATISVRVPLTLSIVEGFTVDAAREAYLIPLESVRECIELPRAIERHEDACGVMALRGGVLPFVRLRDLFALPGTPPERENVVVVEHAGKRAGLAVDTLRGRTQAVVKPLAPLLRGTDAISGTTLLGDGRVALILDVPALLRDVERKRARSPRARMEAT